VVVVTGLSTQPEMTRLLSLLTQWIPNSHGSQSVPLSPYTQVWPRSA
jgi:hypothetical protein